MSVRSKLLVSLLTVVLVYSAVNYGVERSVVYPSFVELEQERARQEILRVKQALNRELRAIQAVCRDYASSDDMRRFAREPNGTRPPASAAPAAFRTNRIHALYVCDSNGKVLFGKLIDPATGAPLSATELPTERLERSHPLMARRDSQGAIRGVLMTGRGPLFMAGEPIRTADEAGPSRGTVFLGRFLDGETAASIREQTQTMVSFRPVRAGAALPAREAEGFRRLRNGEKIAIDGDKDASRLHAFAVYPDIAGEPAIMMGVEIPRHISATGRAVLGFASGSVLLAGALVLLVMMVTLNRMVLRPISALTKHILATRESEDFVHLLPMNRTDEFGRLAMEYNRLLDGLATTRRDLLAHQEELERRVAERTAELERLNEELRVEIAMHEKSEKALHESEERYAVLFETSLDGILVAEADTRSILYANPAMCRMLEYRRDELLGAPLLSIECDGTLTDAISQFSAKTRQEPIFLEIECRRKDGSVIPVELNATNAFIEGKDCVVGFLRDVTARKVAEADREHLEDRLRQSQKMEAIGQLAGGVAHDFNNVLTSMIGHAQILLQGLGEDHPLRRDVEEIAKGAERSANLTRQLLAFSRKQVLQPRVLDLNQTIANLEKMLRRLIGEDVQLFFLPDERIGAVKADPGQIEQVILNLVVNARDAMPDGGTLTIETTDLRIEQPDLHKHVGVAPGRYVLLSVTDSGCGMDEETMSRIFEPFFTTKEAGKGTGLGLSTAYGIIQQSGGCILLDSEPGKGASFHIYLPVVSEIPDAVTHKPIPAEVPKGEGTVLLVEDEDAVRDLIRETLPAFGYTVLAAHDGQEALEICRTHEGPLDLLLTDVIMPNMSGRELADQLLALRPATRVLYMSGYTDDVIVHKGVLNNGAAFLEKPFTIESLALKLHEVLTKA